MFSRGHEEFGPFGRGRGGFGDPFRAGRGMMEPAIIGALTDRPMHGYEIIKTLEEKSHGMWRPSPGSVYPTLQLLEEKGHVKSHEEDGKKVYELTDEGKQVAEAAAQQREQWKEGFADRLRGMKDMRHVMGETMKLMRDIHRKGSAEQNMQLNAAIHDFNERLKQILEEDKA